MPLWLTEADVRAVLSMADAMAALEPALIAFSTGHVCQPVRTAFDLRPRAFFALMPAYQPQRALLGAKLLSVVPENAARGLPTHLAAISLFDPETGQLLAVMDGRWITEARTAAVSALSARCLARRDATTLAILGSGVQARSHVHALRRVRPLSQIRVWSPNPDHVREFVQEMGSGVQAAESAAAAVRDADIVLAATNSATPALDSAWVSGGAHVIAIGACRPTQRELDAALLERARVVVDSREAAWRESGDIVQSIAEGRMTRDRASVELGEILAGSRPGRADASEVTLFKSLGLAIEDVAAAAVAYQRAREAGRGLQVEF